MCGKHKRALWQWKQHLGVLGFWDLVVEVIIYRGIVIWPQCGKENTDHEEAVRGCSQLDHQDTKDLTEMLCESK